MNPNVNVNVNVNLNSNFHMVENRKWRRDIFSWTWVAISSRSKGTVWTILNHRWKANFHANFHLISFVYLFQHLGSMWPWWLSSLESRPPISVLVSALLIISRAQLQQLVALHNFLLPWKLGKWEMKNEQLVGCESAYTNFCLLPLSLYMFCISDRISIWILCIWSMLGLWNGERNIERSHMRERRRGYWSKRLK